MLSEYSLHYRRAAAEGRSEEFRAAYKSAMEGAFIYYPMEGEMPAQRAAAHFGLDSPSGAQTAKDGGKEYFLGNTGLTVTVRPVESAPGMVHFVLYDPAEERRVIEWGDPEGAWRALEGSPFQRQIYRLVLNWLSGARPLV